MLGEPPRATHVRCDRLHAHVSQHQVFAHPISQPSHRSLLRLAAVWRSGGRTPLRWPTCCDTYETDSATRPPDAKLTRATTSMRSDAAAQRLRPTFLIQIKCC